MNMKPALTLLAAQSLALNYGHLIGQPMPNPYSGLPITSITVEKNNKSKGFSVILSHDIFDGGIPEQTGFKCPKVDLMTYLSIPKYL